MKKLSIQIMALCSVFGLASGVMAEDCKPAPGCGSLGFTQNASDCSGAALKCPWDLSKAACNTATAADIGDILYGDGTTSSKLISSKTPIGVVFDTENRLAVALTDIDKDGSTTNGTSYYWSSSRCDTPNLDNCTRRDGLTTCGVDGRANTNAILASTCNGTTYAANGTNAYEPSGCSKDFCKKTKWFLPSMRDLITLYNAKSYVNASLSLTASSGAKTLTENYYWSSTEYSSGSAWNLWMVDGYRYNNTKYDYNSRYVRPVLAF